MCNDVGSRSNGRQNTFGSLYALREVTPSCRRALLACDARPAPAGYQAATPPQHPRDTLMRALADWNGGFTAAAAGATDMAAPHMHMPLRLAYQEVQTTSLSSRSELAGSIEWAVPRLGGCCCVSTCGAGALLLQRPPARQPARQPAGNSSLARCPLKPAPPPCRPRFSQACTFSSPLFWPFG